MKRRPVNGYETKTKFIAKATVKSCSRVRLSLECAFSDQFAIKQVRQFKREKERKKAKSLNSKVFFFRNTEQIRLAIQL